MLLARRSFLTGLAVAVAAPAVVRSGVLMPLRGVIMPAVTLENVVRLPFHYWLGYEQNDEIVEVSPYRRVFRRSSTLYIVDAAIC